MLLLLGCGVTLASPRHAEARSRGGEGSSLLALIPLLGPQRSVPQHVTPKCLSIFSTGWEKACPHSSGVTARLHLPAAPIA